jgi:hypothetical protein
MTLRRLLTLVGGLLSFAAAATAAQAQGHAVSGAEVMRLTQQYVNVAPKRYIGSPGEGEFCRRQVHGADADWAVDDA